MYLITFLHSMNLNWAIQISHDHIWTIYTDMRKGANRKPSLRTILTTNVDIFGSKGEVVRMWINKSTNYPKH